jgi:hypothetical protein
MYEPNRGEGLRIILRLKKKLDPRGKDRPLSIALLEEGATIFKLRKVVKAHHHVGCVTRKPRTPTTASKAQDTAPPHE